MQGAEALIVIPITLVLAYLLITWKAKWARTAIEKHLKAQNIDASIEKVGIPPLRLWLRNRKGDSWAKLQYPDGSTRWARLRSRWGDASLEFFE